ncbi:Transposable element tcb1 transposase [Caligus rogercresseyi]|uniref:Transposable element tcb1 transposase n=1 Tax=Caligus rogercresseyi TaxID=217165 RepID=A0A7T8KAD6_CALRO|nr:Transposable element tcb1 transposase [Caligus rogercresseyi]
MINDDPSVPMSTLAEIQTVVKPWMTQIAAGRPYLYQQDGAPAHTSNLVQNWCLENLDMFWSKEFWPPAALTSTPATTTCGASLRGTLTSVLTTLWTP